MHSTRTSFSTNLQPKLHTQSSFEIEDRPIEPTRYNNNDLIKTVTLDMQAPRPPFPVDLNVPRQIHRIPYSPINAQFLPAIPSVFNALYTPRINSRGEYSTATSSVLRTTQQMERFTLTHTERIESAKDSSDATITKSFHELDNKGHFSEKLYDASFSYSISTKVREFLQKFWQRCLDRDETIFTLRYYLASENIKKRVKTI
ncbi:hypothetical protein GcC1_038035 [Golovinomyces cichoracearum]|uniref:Uncharacterized protein n=1 Tax=Golovinomyces cichoracearum TaxID=62708 RepID=A0A420J0J0_9PEZI|nr:hypothetical protein GcC1_038035 [Golovinomyces cichoracearum]